MVEGADRINPKSQSTSLNERQRPLPQRNDNYHCFMVSSFLIRLSCQARSVTIFQLLNFEIFGLFHKGEPHDDWELPLERSPAHEESTLK